MPCESTTVSIDAVVNSRGPFSSAAGQAGPRLLVVVGTDGDAQRKAQGGSRLAGNSDIFKLLRETFRFEQLNLGKHFLRQRGRPDLSRYDCLLNLVTDADQHPKTLDVLRKLVRGFGGKIFNHPEAVLRTGRDRVARQLANVGGLCVPRTIRLRVVKPHAPPPTADAARLDYPAILRRAGTHGGVILGKIDGHAQLVAALREPGEYVLTEYVDYRSSDGLYRKYRVFFIGQHRIFRHLIVADSWNIHARERFAFMAHHPGLIGEELRILERPAGLFPTAVSTTLDAVRRTMALDFFGMDFGIAPDGRVLLFEANATMNFFPVVDEPPFAHIACVIRPARLAFAEMMGVAAQARPAAAPRIAAAS